MAQKITHLDSLARHVDRARRRGDIRAVSFDVFDTLIHRRVPAEAIIDGTCRKLEELCQQAGRPPLLSVHEAREQAYQQVASQKRPADGDADCTLAEFAPVWTARCLGTDDERSRLFAEQIVEFEIQQEYDSSFSNTPMLNFVRSLAERGVRLLFASDMYLGRSAIERLLTKNGYGNCFETGYVSSDWRAYKWSGKLFRRLLQAEGLQAANLLHIGDNVYSDGRVPARQGIRAFIWSDKRDIKRRDFLQRQYRHSQTNERWSGVFVAVAAKQDSRLNMSRDMAFGYEQLGPVLLPFVHRVCEISREQRLDRLYFMARDGYLYQRIYDILAPTLPGMDCVASNYLALSRAAVFPASRNRLVKKDFSHWLASNPLTLRSALYRYGLPGEVIDDACRRVKLSPSQPLTEDDLESPEFLDLLTDKDLQQKLFETAAARRSALQRYLKRTGFLAGGRVGLVDIGWAGTTQRLLGELFGQQPDFPSLQGLYLAFKGERNQYLGGKSLCTGVLADRRHLGYYGFSAFSFLHALEAFSPAPHGTVQSFADNGDPQLMDEKDPLRLAERKNEACILRIQNGVLAYAAHYAATISLMHFKAEQTLPLARSLLARMAWRPSAEEAERLLRLMFSESYGEGQTNSIGHSLRGAPLTKRLTDLLQRGYRNASWGRGVLATYELPLLGYAYSLGSSLRLLQNSDSAAMEQERHDVVLQNSSVAKEFEVDGWSQALLKRLETRHIKLCEQYERNEPLQSLDALSLPLSVSDWRALESARLAANVLVGRNHRHFYFDGLSFFDKRK